MLRIGIQGYNETAERFIETVNATHHVMLSGIQTDVAVENAALAGTGLTVCDSFRELIEKSDLIVLTESDANVLPLAEKVIKLGRHVYVHQLRHFQDDYIAYLGNLAREAEVKTCVHFELLYHPVVSKLQSLLGDPQIIDVSLGRMEGSSEDVKGDRYLVAATLLALSLSRRFELPRLHAQTLHRIGSGGNPVQLRLEYPSGCLANVMLHGDAVPGHNRVRVYQGSGYVEADLDFGLISTQGYTDNAGPMPASQTNDALINVEALPETESGFKRFLNNLLRNNAEDYVTFDKLYEAVKAIAPVRQKLQRVGLSVQ